MLCTEPWLSPWASSAACAVVGAEMYLQPLPRGIFPLRPAQGCSQASLATDWAQYGYGQP